MSISAKIIADSVSPTGIRLTSVQLVYPRFIHGEVMTHRVFTRNASSSRAIPVAKMIEQVRSNPAEPIHWGKNQPGMQASEELNSFDAGVARAIWYAAARDAAYQAEQMMHLGVHKQVANRILEPFQFMHTLITATEWANFFELRRHPDAQPEIHALADEIHSAMAKSYPREIAFGQWHLPYITLNELDKYDSATLRKASAARCARTSYLKHDGSAASIDDDLKLFDRLAGSRPIHASPTEHQAVPALDKGFYKNFRGWLQFRALIESTADQMETR